MSFDAATRNRLAKLVGDVRTLLTVEFLDQCRTVFGITASGQIAAVEQLVDLDDAERATAALLRERVEYLIRTHPGDKGGAPHAVTQLVREQAFTVLNRFAALRMAEKRGLVTESVGKGYQSKGFKVFETVAGTGLGDTYHRYRQYLHCLFDELAVDLGVLFDRRSPQGTLFPRETALLECLALLNAFDIETIWAEDETIGWVYQYYNDPAERKKMRDESAAPRTSRELAVRNQFFTPRYVVEFLTDNTLGRTWYEMVQGRSRILDRCHYLVREQLPGRVVHRAPRPLKDPREIRMLDPACGSMHFGLYAFDLFEIIYEEAWDIACGSDEAPKSVPSFANFVSFAGQFADKTAFLADVPRLIIEHNLHGIDIDARAAQIAGLSLWLRAQRSWQQQGLPPRERPRVSRSNVASAEPMPGDEVLLNEFIETHLIAAPERTLLAQLVRRVFDAMKLAGEAGSLLKIEEEIASAVQEAKQKWLSAPLPQQVRLFADDATKPVQQALGLDVTGITDEAFWENAEERIYAALRTYAEQVEHGRGYQRRLFADDAARGFALIDICRKRYDAVVMNPPFGEAAPVTDRYLRAAYPLGYIDLYTAFLDRGWGLTAEGGLVGAITSRTALTLSSFESWRKARLLGDTNVGVCADLGYGVLDGAMVETAAYTLQAGRPDAAMLFVDLDRVKDKAGELLAAVAGKGDKRFVVSPSELLQLPNATMAYFLEPSLRDDFNALPAISQFAEVLGGNATSDDERFIRCFWEIAPVSLKPASNRQWRWISKGGEYSLFYISLHLVVDWRGDGGYLGDYMYNDRPRNGYLWGPKSWSAAYMGSPGVVWSLRSQKGISFRALPADCVMSGKSAIVTTRDAQTDLALLGILNTERLAKLARSLATFGSYEKGAIGSLPVERTDSSHIATHSMNAFGAALKANSYFETDPYFHTIVRHRVETLHDLLAAVRSDITAQASIVMQELDAINQEYRSDSPAVQEWRLDCISDLAGSVVAGDVVSELMGTAFGRWDVRSATFEKAPPPVPPPFAPLPVCPPGQLQNDQGLPVSREDMRALTDQDPDQYAVDIPWDGILVDDPGHPFDIEARVHRVLQIVWRERWEAIERELCELLGMPSLREYFRKPSGFFGDHLKQYSKSRRQAPIYWPLSTAKGSYTLWVYYHRLTDQTLHAALADFVEPKIRATERALGDARADNRRQETDDLTDLLSELQDFRAELERLTRLPWKPNLNDGVVITASALWKLFRLPKWQRDLKACWDKLAAGEYEWAHLALSVWPDRVRRACETDRSIATAHDLEELFKTSVTPKKPARSRRNALSAKSVAR